MRASFERECTATGVQAELYGPDARMTFGFGDHAALPPERLEALFLTICAENGVLTNINILPSYAHDAEALELTAAAFT